MGYAPTAAHSTRHAPRTASLHRVVLRSCVELWAGSVLCWCDAADMRGQAEHKRILCLQVRPIAARCGLLPRVHGSALFTRGETQAICTATLGDRKSRQFGETLANKFDRSAESFYLQYFFPPSCVGETGRMGMPGRREIGHGKLAERALAPALKVRV